MFFKCREKYGPGHKCPKLVHLHVLEELLEVFQISEDGDMDEEATGSSDEELVLSECAIAGTTGKRTIRLQGLIQKEEILILVNSGSFSNFISENLIGKLELQAQDSGVSQVTIADGGKMTCSKVINGLEWWCQELSFTTDLKVLPLGGYDMILGMEWLEEFSPMWVDWNRKKLRFTYQEKRATLVGVKEQIQQCKSITGKQLKGMIKHGELSQLVQLCAI